MSSPWTHPALDARIALLDQTSHDIRALERYLQDANVPLFTRVPIAANETITWATVDHRGWRIWHDPPTGPSRPLIETPAAVRLRAKAALPALVSGIARAAEAVR